MVFDPTPEQVNVRRMMIYSILPILSFYALWRIQKFWLITLILIPIYLGIEILDIMSDNLGYESNLDLINIVAIVLHLGFSLSLVRHYAHKYNEKISNII